MTESKQVKLDQTAINIIVAVCVILLTLVFFLIYRRGKSSRRTIILTGVCDSGKTLIHTLLTQDKFVNTHTSIKENVGEYTTAKGKIVEVIDIPGHERLRGKYLDQYRKTARGLVYVIDSLTLQKDIRDVADYLCTLLTDHELSGCQNVLIFCNKQDHPTAKGVPVIKNLLEKELNVIRETRSHSLKSTEGTSTKESYLGVSGEDFEFSQCLPTMVAFAEGYAFNKDDSSADSQLDELEDWINAVS